MNSEKCNLSKKKKSSFKRKKWLRWKCCHSHRFHSDDRPGYIFISESTTECMRMACDCICCVALTHFQCRCWVGALSPSTSANTNSTATPADWRRLLFPIEIRENQIDEDRFGTIEFLYSLRFGPKVLPIKDVHVVGSRRLHNFFCHHYNHVLVCVWMEFALQKKSTSHVFG